MAKYPGKKGDLTWGKFDYPVTNTQLEALDALWYMVGGRPQTHGVYELPRDVFYSQRPDSGDVVIGLKHNSVSVHRSGRITSNEGR